MSVDAAETRDSVGRPRSGAGRIQSLDRAVALLEAITANPGGSSAPELAQECAINRATAWRLLATLEHHGLVDRDPHTHRYSVGFTISRMATSASLDGLVRRAHQHLERLSEATGETANLAVPQRLGLTYVDEVTPPVVLSARWLGQQVPMHATSAGKTFLAWLTENEAEAMLASPLAEYTDTTHTDHGALRKELANIHARGYGVGIGELETRVNGVAAPILDERGHPFGIVSVWGPDDRVGVERFDGLGERARETANEIAGALR